MKYDWELMVQGYVDGELSARDARQVESLLQKEPAARELFSQLQSFRTQLKANEVERAVPESRDFYWSKIQREINRAEALPAPSVSWFEQFLLWKRRYIAGVGSLAIATCLAVGLLLQSRQGTPDIFEVIETPLEETSAFAFRSESQRITLVWLYDRQTAVADDFSEEFYE